jgi:hypothetical protein
LARAAAHFISLRAQMARIEEAIDPLSKEQLRTRVNASKE